MKVLRIDEVVERTGLSRTSIWRLEKAGQFPARRQLGPGSVGWLEKEVERWANSRPVAGPRGQKPIGDRQRTPDDD